MELIGSPSDGETHGYHLSGCMDSAVSPAGGYNGPPGAGEALQSTFHLTLDRPALCLELPPEEIRSVVVDCQLKSVLAFWVHADKVERRGGTSRKGWT